MNGDNEWMFPGSQDYHILRKIIVDSLLVENLNKQKTNKQTFLLELTGL